MQLNGEYTVAVSKVQIAAKKEGSEAWMEITFPDAGGEFDDIAAAFQAEDDEGEKFSVVESFKPNRSLIKGEHAIQFDLGEGSMCSFAQCTLTPTKVEVVGKSSLVTCRVTLERIAEIEGAIDLVGRPALPVTISAAQGELPLRSVS